MILVLLGPPGAGKGTQCKRIIERYSLTHLSSGDILRAERAQGSELGKKAQSYMDAGELVPDDVIIEMMVKAVNGAGGNCVLDGFPRTVVQADELDKALAENSRQIDAVVNLVIDDAVVMDRITGRRSCIECGQVYHIETLKPKTDGLCDSCGSGLVQREDDKPEVVANRLKNYHSQTAAVAGYYSENGNLIFEIAADGDIDGITTSIFEKLNGLTTV